MSVGKIIKVFSPDEKYSRHSEGDFLRLKDGRLLFVYCRFQNTYHDDAYCELVSCVSEDEGETWSEPRNLLSPEMYETDNIMSVSLMRMANGDLGLFYLIKVTPNNTRIVLSRSNDEGETFYSHVDCADINRPFYYVVNNSRVERLKSGRLVVPAALHPGTCGANGQYYVDGRCMAVFFLSDDDGFTWRVSKDTVYPSFTDTRTGLQEPGVFETNAGGLHAYFRTDKQVQYESFSVDGGERWSVPQPSRFSAPASPLEIVRNPKDDALYAVWNPMPMYNGRAKHPAGWGRTPLVCAISRDDGTTWGDPVVLADDPEHGYCYPAIFFTEDDSMLIAYCSGGPDEGICLAQLTIQKIPMKDIR